MPVECRQTGLLEQEYAEAFLSLIEWKRFGRLALLFSQLFDINRLHLESPFGLVLISSLLTLGGGILSLMRKGYGLTIVGCIAGIFTLTFPINLVMCVIAFFVLILSYEEFHSGATNRPYKPKKKKVTWKGYEPRPPYE